MTDKSDRHSLSKFAAIFALGTMLSRVLGLVRDVLINVIIPVGPREAFLVAFRLPNMLRDIVGEGAANAAFIPVMSETLEKRKEKAFREVVASAFGAMILLLGAITIVGVVFVPEMLQGVNILQPITGGKEYAPDELALLTALSRWTFPYIFFIGLAVFSMATLFTVKHYSTPSWAPALLNVAMIGCILAFAWTRVDPEWEKAPQQLAQAAWALVIGIWIGGIAQVAAQYYAMGKYTGVWRPSFDVRRKEVATMFALLGPIVIGQAAGEVNKLVDLMFAYKSGAGAVTWLYSANRLVQLPLTIFGFATAAAVLPAASRAAARNDHGEMREVIRQGLRQSFFMVLPSMIGLIVLGTPIVKLIFGWGQTRSATDIEGITTATVIYATGLLAFAWVKVTVSGFFAVKDTRSPVIISSGSMILNMILCALWVKPYGYQGLAWATTISYTANFVALYALLSVRHGALWDGPFLTALVRMSAATAGMATVGYATYVGVSRFVPNDGIVERLVQAGLPIAASVGAFLLFAWMFGVTELHSFAQLVTRRFSKQKK